MPILPTKKDNLALKHLCWSSKLNKKKKKKQTKTVTVFNAYGRKSFNLFHIDILFSYTKYAHKVSGFDSVLSC